MSHTKQRVNLTISENVIREAKALGLNASRAAETGIADAVRKAKEDAWLEENKASIAAHNQRVAEDGVLIRATWTEQG